MLDRSPEKATDKAKDLTNLVKRKAPIAQRPDTNEAGSQGNKRKADADDDVRSVATKKARNDTGAP